MNVSLPPELEDFVQAKVASGEYKDAAEVVQEAMRDLVSRHASYDEWLRAEIMKGVEAADRGELEPHNGMQDIIQRALDRNPDAAD